MYKRIITVLTYNEGCLYRTKKFTPDYSYTSNFLDYGMVDEIVALDISRSEGSRDLFYQAIENIVSQCFVPLSIGGKIKTLEDATRLFKLGADKLVVNTAALDDPHFISQLANKYGSQAVIVSVDVKKEQEAYIVYKNNGQVKTGYQVLDWVKQAEIQGAGEIMINSMDRDGSLMGYDNQLCRAVINHVNMPVLVCGGAGNWKHFYQG